MKLQKKKKRSEFLLKRRTGNKVKESTSLRNDVREKGRKRQQQHCPVLIGTPALCRRLA